MTAFIDFLNTSANVFVEFASSMLIQSSALIIALLLLDYILRRRVRAIFRYCIWMLVLAKLVLPTSLSLPTGVGYWFGDKLSFSVMERTINPTDSAMATETHVQQALPHQELPADITHQPQPSGTGEPIETLAAPVAHRPVILETQSVSLTWYAYVLSGWFAILAVMVLLLVQRFVFVKKLIQQAEDADGEILKIFAQCRKDMGVTREINLKYSSVTASPAVCGLFKPTILIPVSLSRAFDSQQLRSIVLHELAHVKRGDLTISFVQTILQIFYFYNPLLWLANSKIRNVREQAVDEMVLVAMGEDAGDYPETLLHVSRMAFSRPALSLRLIGVIESKKALSTRIKHILSRPFPKSAKLGIIGLISIVIAAAVLLPMAKAGSAKTNNDWSKPTEHWKTKPIEKTKLTTFFGGWRNLPFKISADEELAVKRCRRLFIRWHNMEPDVADNARKELEAVLSEWPGFFYPEFLLGMWHRDYGDKAVGKEFIKKAYEHAPVILVQKYQDENGEPLSGLRIQTYDIECNKVRKRSLSQCNLKFRDLVTDENGCIYVPVYDTVYRIYSTSFPSGYNIAYPTLGFFKAKSKVALMPTAKNNSTDGGEYETAKASKDFKVKVGPTEFKAHSVIRWQRDGNVVIKNPDGSGKRVIDMETADYSSQARWMDIAQIRLSPAPEKYEVVKLRVFDHDQRKLLSEEDYLAVGYDRRDVSVNLYSAGQLLPEKVDVWMRVLHKPDKKKVWRIKSQANAKADIEGVALGILNVKDGGDYSYSSNASGIKWGKHDRRSDGLATTISLKFARATKDQYQVCAVSKDDRRYVPDSPHFIRGANGIQVLTFAFPKDQIAYFEISPFHGRDTLYFDGIKLPEVSDEFDSIPEVRFRIDGKEGQFANTAFAPFELELQTFKGKRVVGLASSSESWRCSFYAKDAYEGTCGFAFKAPGLSMKLPEFEYYDQHGNSIESKPTHKGSGLGKTLTMAYESLNLPIDKIHSVGLQIGKKGSNETDSLNSSGRLSEKEMTRHNFFTAVRGGDLAKVKQFIAQGFDVNAASLGGPSAIHEAGPWGQTEIAWLLIKAGANIHHKDRHGRTALFSAASYSHKAEPTAKLLIENGADVTLADDKGMTPLHHACTASMCKMLIDKGADIHAQDDRGWTSLHYDSNWARLSAVKFLIANGADIEARDKQGRTPIMLASTNAKRTIIDYLLNHKANISSKDDQGRTPLHWAVIKNKDEIRELLNGQTAGGGKSQSAVDKHYSKMAEAVRLLIARGADLNAKDAKGLTALDCAKAARNEKVIKAMKDFGGLNVSGRTSSISEEQSARQGRHYVRLAGVEDGLVFSSIP
jgi:beta-lactamase regulating signal transducer with metallopeptidase domain/ankyrin repeat protein